MTQPRAVCFDLDNTLWDVWPAITRAEQALHAWLEQHWPRITARHDVAAMRAARATLFDEFPERRHDLSFLRREALRRLAQEAGYPESLADDGFELFYSIRNQVEPYPDVLPALEALRTRYRLLSLSNGNADLGRIGMAHWFEHSLGAREAGAAKPDARIFQVLLERAGLRAAEVLYVGDEPLADIEGARGAGLPAVWINRAGHTWPEAYAPPHRTVATLTELADALLD